MFFKKKNDQKKNENLKISAVVSGKLIPLSKLEDGVFSENIVGNGFAIVPEDKVELVFAPFDGRLDSVFETGHAYGITDNSKNTDVQCLIHIGIDTVELKGQGFSKIKDSNDVVNTGDALVEVDFPLIREKGKKTAVVVVFPHEQSTEKGYDIKILKTGNVLAGDIVAEIYKK